jgi:uncharacterized membrane protein YfcA
LIAFSSTFVNSIAGGGYGTMITPQLLIIGFNPLQFIPSILLSHSIISFILVYNNRNKNQCEAICYNEKKLISYIIVFGIIGLIFSISIVSVLNIFYIQLYIGFLTIFLGGLLIFLRKRKFIFSYKRIMGISLIAAFNKGISGGGYGTIISSGQMLSGVECKKALSNCFYAEAIISLIGFFIYVVFIQNLIIFELTVFILIGAFLAIPFATRTMHKVTNNKLTLIVGFLLILLGVLTLLQLL